MAKKEYKLKIKTDKDTLTDTYGKFVLQPLERGYGVTVGNALRRVLLTSLPGAAITNVKVDGVLHEFSTISGVKEDMADIIQNLKSVRFKLSDSDVDNVKLTLKGKKVFTAADIQKATDQFEVLNQDQYITSLLNYAACRSMTDKKQLLELGKTWWMESNRLIPITIFLHSELEKLKYCQINMNTKDVQILTGPTVNLSNINVKRIKRKNIQLVRKPKK